MTEILFPWPPAELSPNARCHWAKKARIIKKYRADCFYLTKAAKAKAGEGAILLDVVFYPPTPRSRDMDNMIASVKALLDGLADALGVNDSRFSITYAKGDRLGGKVSVRFPECSTTNMSK